MTAKITAIHLEDLIAYLGERPAVARRAARLAINDTTRRKAVPRLRKAVQAEVNFPAGYVNKDRLDQTRQASDNDLNAVVTARFRPTSLARFAGGQSFDGARRTGGVRVRVKRGGAVRLPGAFFVRLRRGADTSDGFNMGLALRLRPGQRLRGRKKGGASVQLAPNLYLLYGPSVDQVFRDVAVAESPTLASDLEQEFVRQWVRLNASV